MTTRHPWFGTLLMALALSACDQNAIAPSEHRASSDRKADALPLVVVHKNASCGCCDAWVEHMRANGFEVQVHDVDNLNFIKEQAGIPVDAVSCHTAEVGGYFVEGHVPAADVRRLLETDPDAKGITAPGMPHGSPGMEQGSRRQPYDVLLVHRDGSTSVFAHHGD